MKRKDRVYEILLIITFILIEAAIVKLFYSKGDILNFKSVFWIIRELAVLAFLGIFSFALKKDTGYFDVFIIFFPILGLVLLLMEKSLFFWKVSREMVEKILYIEKSGNEDEKVIKSPESFNVMSYNELLLSDDSEKKKKFLYSYKPEKISLKTEVLRKALLDENIDVIHYAATELNKIDTDIQSEINTEEKRDEKDEIRIYYLYKKYAESGLLLGTIEKFYINKMFSMLDGLKINSGEKKSELLYLYNKSGEKEKYEKLVKDILNEDKDISVISDYLKFLHKENRFKELLEEYRKYSSLDIEKPYFLEEYL